MKRLTCTLVTASSFLAACTSLQSPPLAYSDAGRALSETAVLISDQRTQTEYKAHILNVDGEYVGCAARPYWRVGSEPCAYWIRVVPGTHKFKIDFTTDVRNAGLLSYKFRSATPEIVIPNMKAKHVYLLHFPRTSDSVDITYEDVGENSGHGIRVCKVGYGDCTSTYVPKFD